MDDEKWTDKGNMKEERRSRSPIEKNSKNNRGRDPSGNRNRNNNRNNRSRSPRGRRNRAPTNRRIYVANIAYDCKWTTVKDLFREKVGDVSYVELFEDENGKFRGCGIVEFKDSSSVQKAVDTLHRFEYKGRQLVVKEDFDVDRDKTGKPMGRSRGGGGGGGGGSVERGGGSNNNMHDRDDYDMGGMRGGSNGSLQYNTYGLSPQFLSALRISGPLTTRIFVANLDYKITEKKLEEVFKLAGRVLKIDLKRDDEGKSKGHGTIEMGHPVEAVQAISMFNGQKFYNRPMSVRMDKKHSDESEDKRLPEGLQSVGKGLGANGLPLHLSNSAGVNNLPPTGMGSMGGLGGVGANALNIMSPQLSSAAVLGSSGTGIPGLSSIGMSLQDRNFSGLGGTGGLGGSSSGLLPGSLGASGAAGLSAAGLGASGLGSALTGGLGLGLGAGGVTGGGGLSGYGDYDRSFDRGDDGYRAGRSSDTVVLRNLPLTFTWENVRDRCADFGDVQSTEMKGRGMALVRFSSDRDAARAIDRLRNTRIYGRQLDASFY